MHSKLCRLLTVCLTATALLVPVEQAFGSKLLTHETKGEKIQHLLCVRKAENYLRCQVASYEGKNINDNKSLRLATATRPAPNSTQPKSITKMQQSLIINTINANLLQGLLLIASGSGIGLLLCLHSQRRYDRVIVLRRNIETLERIWRISNQR